MDPNHARIPVIPSSVSLSLPATASSTRSPSASPRLSSRASDSPDEVSIPASDSVPADSSSPSSAEESSSSSLSMSQRPSSTGSFEPGPSSSPPVKNPAANPPNEETKPESLSSSKAPGSTPAPNPPPAPESSQRSSSQSPPAQPSSSRAPPPPPASTPRTRTAERPQSSVAPSPASQDAPPSSTSVQASTTPRVVGAIGQTSSSQSRSTITRTITDVPDSTFSRPMSITVTDTNGQTSVSAPPFVTVLSTSTEPDGAVETYTHIIANPTDLGASTTALGNQSVLSNRGAAAGIFISVGIAAAAITAVIFFLCRRRRRRLRRERWLTGIHRPVPPPDPFDDPPMASVNVLADDITRSTNGRNLLDDELRSSVSSSRPMISQPQPTLSSGAAGRGAHGQGIINPFDSNQASHPHTNIGLAITSDHYTDLQRQSRVSLAPSTPSIYPASLAPSDRDVDSLYEQESSNAHLNTNASALLAPQAPPPLTIPLPVVRQNIPPRVPPRSLSRPKSAKLTTTNYNPFTPTSLTPPSSVSSHSKPNTPTDSESGRPMVHVWDEHTAAMAHEHLNQPYAKNPVDLLTRRTFLDVRPRVNRDTFGAPLS